MSGGTRSSVEGNGAYWVPIGKVCHGNPNVGREKLYILRGGPRPTRALRASKNVVQAIVRCCRRRTRKTSTECQRTHELTLTFVAAAHNLFVRVTFEPASAILFFCRRFPGQVAAVNAGGLVAHF